MNLRRTTLLFFCSIAFFTIPLALFSAEYLFFDRNSSFPTKLKSDPNEFQNISSFQKENFGKFSGETFFELGFSDEASVISIRNQRDSAGKDIINFGVVGGIVSKFDFNSKSFDLFCTDFKGGFFAVYNAPWEKNNKFVLLLYHNSSHLGDDFIKDYSGIPFNSSYEILKVFHYFSILKNLDLTWGIHYIVRKDTSVKISGRGTVQLNAEYAIPFKNRKFFLAADMQSSGMYNWQPSFSFMAGFQLSEIKPYNPAQSIAVGYYTGHSHFGQFFEDRSTLYYLAMIVNF